MSVNLSVARPPQGAPAGATPQPGGAPPQAALVPMMLQLLQAAAAKGMTLQDVIASLQQGMAGQQGQRPAQAAPQLAPTQPWMQQLAQPQR